MAGAGDPALEDQVGPDDIAQNTFGTVFQLFDTFSVKPTAIFDAGDAVFATGVYEGTSKGGKQLEADFAHHWGLGPDGKVTYFRTYTDTKLWVDALSS